MFSLESYSNNTYFTKYFTGRKLRLKCAGIDTAEKVGLHCVCHVQATSRGLLLAPLTMRLSQYLPS